MKELTFKLFLTLLLLLPIQTAFSQESLPASDFSAQDLNDEQFIDVANNWIFFWNKYVPPGEASRGGVLVGQDLPWNLIPDAQNGFPVHGYGTYAQKIKLPKRTSTNLAFKMRRVKTAYAMYIDGDLVSYTGHMINYPNLVGVSINNTGIVDFHVPLDKSEINVIIHVSSNEYYRGGLDQPPQLAYSKTAHTSKLRETLSAALIAGALLIMGFYHFGLWLKRRSNVTSLYFSIFTIAVGARSFFTYKLAYLIYPNLSENFMLWCETLLAYTAIPFLHIFISSSFLPDSNKYLTRLSWGTWISLMIVSFGTNLYYMSKALTPFEIYFIIILFHMIYIGVVAVHRKREFAKIFSLGFLTALAAGIHDVLFYNGTYLGFGRAIFPFGVLIFVFIQFILHSMRFSRAYMELEVLTNTLESQVDERTKELMQAHQDATKAHEETRYLSNAITNLLEEERKSISRELHDDFGQSLRATGLIADAISRNLKKLGVIADELDKSISNADYISVVLMDMYHKNRNLLRRLRPEIIDTLGLVSAIEELLDNYRQHDYSIDFKCEADVSGLDHKEKITIYRILQEAITNIIKYANTKHFSVSLTETADEIIFSIVDNGSGFDISTARGVGLISMRERMADIGGHLNVQSQLEKGTSISAKFPKKTLN